MKILYEYMHIQEWTVWSLAISHWKRCQSAYNARANKCHSYRKFDYNMLFLFYIFHGGWLYTYVNIFNWLFPVLWDYTACLNLSFGESRIVFTVKLHERHRVTNPHPIYCLFKSIAWQTTNETLKLSRWKRNLCNKLFLHLWHYSCRCVSLPFEK